MPAPAWLILPTYNEAENIEAIVRASLDVIRATAADGHRILIVDDGSPDGTGAIADRLAAELPDEVEVLHRPAQGRPRARLSGRLPARTRGRAPTTCCEMDADFSHDPADLARLLGRRRTTPTSRSARATCPAARSSDWGLLRRVVSARRLLVRAARARRARARPDRRLQVLPARGARGASTSTPCARTATASRSSSPTGRTQRLPRARDADRLPRPRSGHEQDDPAHRDGGRLEVPAAAIQRDDAPTVLLHFV